MYICACVFTRAFVSGRLWIWNCAAFVHKFFVEFPVFWIRLGCVVVCLLCRCRNVTPLAKGSRMWMWLGVRGIGQSNKSHTLATVATGASTLFQVVCALVVQYMDATGCRGRCG